MSVLVWLGPSMHGPSQQYLPVHRLFYVEDRSTVPVSVGRNFYRYRSVGAVPVDLDLVPT